MVVSGVGSLSTDMESSGFFSDIGRGSNAVVARRLIHVYYKSRRRVSIGNLSPPGFIVLCLTEKECLKIIVGTSTNSYGTEKVICAFYTV
jgi:hypothetical protein